MTRENFDAYRLRGLLVDEDFERGISPGERIVRTGLLTALVTVLTLSAIFVMMPERAPVRLGQRSFKSHSHTPSARPLWIAPAPPTSPTAPMTPVRRARANV